MNKHLWVQLAMVPIEVELQPNGHLHTFVTEGALESAEEDTRLGCWFCYTPLTTETFNTECNPEIISTGP